MGHPDRSWMTVAHELRDAITLGEYQPGDRLPTSRELKARYNVHTQTVQTALDRLVDEGLVESKNGLGRVVAGHISLDLIRTSPDWAERNTRRSDAQRSGSWSPDFHFTFGSEPASAAVARDLRVRVGTGMWVRRRLQRDGEQVLHVSREYLPRHIIRNPAFEKALSSREVGTYALLRQAGHQLARFEETVEVVSATEAEAEMLDLDPRRPAAVLRITRIAYDRRGQAVEVNYVVAPARRIKLRYDLPGFP